MEPKLVQTVLQEGIELRPLVTEDRVWLITLDDVDARFAITRIVPPRTRPGDVFNELRKFLRGDYTVVCELRSETIPGIETLDMDEAGMSYHILDVHGIMPPDATVDYMPFPAILARVPRKTGHYRGGGRPKVHPWDAKRRVLTLMASDEEWAEFEELRGELGVAGDAYATFQQILGYFRENT